MMVCMQTYLGLRPYRTPANHPRQLHLQGWFCDLYVEFLLIAVYYDVPHALASVALDLVPHVEEESLFFAGLVVEDELFLGFPGGAAITFGRHLRRCTRATDI